MGAGLAWGVLNGFLVAKARIPALIVTLGTLGMAMGASLLITGGVDEREIPFKLVTTIGTGRLFDQIPYLVIIAFAVALVFGIILAGTRFGRFTYAVGSNEEAARRAGINVDRHLIKVYALSGTLAGLAGFMSLARFSTTTIGGHDTDNLNAIAAVVIGGTSLFGGLGNRARDGVRRVHPRGPAERVRDRRGAGLLAAGGGGRGAHRRRLSRSASPPLPAPAVREGTYGGGGSHMRFTPRHGRRPVALIGAVLASGALFLAACGDDDSGGGGGSSSSGEGKKYNMTLIAGVKGDEFYITMNCGAQEEARKLGVTLNFQGPNEFAADQQTPIVNAVAAKKPDAVLVAPTDTKAMYAPIKALADAGSKVVLVDTTLEQPDLAVSQIASDNEGGGKTAADTLAKLIGGSGKVFVNNVKPGISTTDAARQGLRGGRQGGRTGLPRPAVQPGRPGQGRGDHEVDPGQEPRPQGDLRREPVLRRGRRRRRARGGQARTRSRSSASTPARSRSPTSRRASCRP